MDLGNAVLIFRNYQRSNLSILGDFDTVFTLLANLPIQVKAQQQTEIHVFRMDPHTFEFKYKQDLSYEGLENIDPNLFDVRTVPEENYFNIKSKTEPSLTLRLYTCAFPSLN